MGVRRAVDIVLDTAHLRGREKLYSYGPLIHNPQTVELLMKRGIIPIQTLDEAKEGFVIIRAHGIPLKERKAIRKKGLKIIDATCPKVAKVQSIIKKHAYLGYNIIIVGEKEHPEVTGLMGYSADKGMVVSSHDEIDALRMSGNICVVAQTTQNPEQYKRMISRIRERFPHATDYDTICETTEKRQSEMQELASAMDAIIVVGGRNSANTQRLAMISKDQGTPTFSVETADEISTIDLSGYQKIGVSAGASTPNWLIDGVIDYLIQNKAEKDKQGIRFFYNMWIISVKTDIFSSFGAVCLSFAGSLIQNIDLSFLNMMIAASYVYGIHTLNRLQDHNFARIKGSFRENTYISHKKTYITTAFIALFIALLFSLMKGGIITFTILLLISLMGIIYNIAVFPLQWKIKRLGDIPGSKTILTAVAWAAVTVLLPLISSNKSLTAATLIAFLFVFVVVFAKSALSDMIDIQSDRLVGKETIPVIIGENRTRQLLQTISITMALLLIFSAIISNITLYIFLLTSVFYIWICLKLYDRKAKLSSITIEGLLGTNYIIAGVSACVWFIITHLAEH